MDSSGRWFVTPREFPAPGYAVIRWALIGYEADDDHDGTFESAQQRADKLNKESQ